MNRKLIAFFLVLLVLTVVLPFMVPTGVFKERIQDIASEKLGAPLRIESLTLAFLPTPRVYLRGIQFGNAREMVIDSATVVLDVTTLFSETRTVSRLYLDKPVIKQEALVMLRQLSDHKTEGPPPLAVRQINVNGAELRWGDVEIPVFNAHVVLGKDYRLDLLQIDSTDGKLHVEASPKPEGYAATIKAEQWLFPAGPAIRIDRLDVELLYAGQKLHVPHIDAQLDHGRFVASCDLDFSQEWRLDSKFSVHGIELDDASKLFTKGIKVSGQISGDGGLSGEANNLESLQDVLALDFRFHVRNGVLHGMDLAKAATLLVKQGTHGGETRFDEFSGVLKMRGKQIELQHAKVSSGLLVAGGHVRVGQDKKLSGRVEVELKQSLSMVAIPLEISGTLEKPSVMPTKAALVGAAVGTGVLGPAGTALGVKAGSALERFFGGKN